MKCYATLAPSMRESWPSVLFPGHKKCHPVLVGGAINIPTDKVANLGGEVR